MIACFSVFCFRPSSLNLSNRIYPGCREAEVLSLRESRFDRQLRSVTRMMVNQCILVKAQPSAVFQTLVNLTLSCDKPLSSYLPFLSSDGFYYTYDLHYYAHVPMLFLVDLTQPFDG